MFEDRDLKKDLLALGLLALVVFLGLALITYDPADPISSLVAPLDQLYVPNPVVLPQHETVANACGKWGALAADLLLTSLGVGAYFLVISLAAVDGLLLARRPVDAPLSRTLGWLLSLIGLVSIASMVAPGWTPGPVIGSGGYAGALVGGLLKFHFALTGGLILSLSLVLGGMLLCTDYLLLRVTVRTVLITCGMMSHAPRIARRRRRPHDVDDLDLDGSEPEDRELEENADEQDGDLQVRIRGKRLAKTAAARPSADDEDYEEFDVDEAWEDDEDFSDGYDEEEEFEDETGDGAEEAEDEESGDDEESRELVAPADSDPGPAIRRRNRSNKKQSRKAARKAAARDKSDEPEKSEREEVIDQLEEASRVEDPNDYELPDINMLIEGDDVCFEEQAKEVRKKARILEKTFADFGFKVKVVEIETGPVIAQYEVELEAGLRLSKITGLADDLAIALRVPSVRIVAPIPGKNTVGIEVPNGSRQVVRLREVIEESNGKTKKMRIPLFLGKDVSGNPLSVDLSTLPHLLIAGRTGTGKSVCLNAIISSILMTKRPDEVRMLMIDPKMVELSGYGRLPHLMHPVVTDMRKAEAILAWAVDKMEERYSLLARAGVRHISSYNQLDEEEVIRRLQPENEEERAEIPLHLPFIVIVADEMADLMMTAGKEVEQHIIRLAQKSRAVGIHLILATQKPTVDVITGLIKSNLPARISFQVASRTDSRVVLDEMGAEKLLGNGDMLFLWPGTSNLLRGQGTYLGDDEIDRVVDSVSTGEQHFVNELLNMKVEEPGETGPGEIRKRDELYEGAIDVVVREGRGSVSLLQRTLGIGYGRAARLIDFMAEDGIVGSYAGSQAREVLLSISDWETMQAGEMPDAPADPPPARKKRSNKIQRDWDDEPQSAPSADKPPSSRKKTALAVAHASEDQELEEPPLETDDDSYDTFEDLDDDRESAEWNEEQDDEEEEPGEEEEDEEEEEAYDEEDPDEEDEYEEEAYDDEDEAFDEGDEDEEYEEDEYEEDEYEEDEDEEEDDEEYEYEAESA